MPSQIAVGAFLFQPGSGPKEDRSEATEGVSGDPSPVSETELTLFFLSTQVHKKKSVGLSQADALTNHIINNTKTNNQ